MVPNYNLRVAVWEITYACNMRCQHCGSSCGLPLPDELTRDEAIALCDDLGKIGIERVTLSGGEPFLRRDWPQIARRLTQNGVTVNAISNGWFIDEALLDQAFANGIVNIGVSIDGYGKTHDMIRKKGSWTRSIKALARMRQRGMPTVACTSINNKNLKELGRLRQKLIKVGVQRWQLQIASPMGNLLKHQELIMTPDALPELVEFCYETMIKTDLIVDLADDVGYCSTKDELIRGRCTPCDKKNGDSSGLFWQGCKAGKNVVGIRANGDISPCLSIRDDSFIEANIRNTPLKDIWTRPHAFSKVRSMSADQLQGFCKACPYAATCLGGCTGLKLTFHNHIHDNTYCMFRLSMEQAALTAQTIESTATLFQKARNHVEANELPQALLYVKRILELDPDHLDALRLGGYLHFMQGDYSAALAYNETALTLAPDDVYTMKGKGLCLVRLDQVTQGIELLKQVVLQTDASFMDPYHDLAVIFMEQQRWSEARAILDLGCKKNNAFLISARPLYQQLRISEHASGNLSRYGKRSQRSQAGCIGA